MILIIYPHQLFEWSNYQKIIDDKNIVDVFLVEDALFFKDKIYTVNFHKQKLILHRASMKYFYNNTISKTIDCEYIEYKSTDQFYKKNKQQEAILFDPTDYILEKRLTKNFKNVILLDTPLFLNTKEENTNYIKENNSLYFQSFYINQRRKNSILIDSENKPVNGKWSFDAENRKKLPKSYSPQELKDDFSKNANDDIDKYISEAKNYIKTNFPNAIGDDSSFNYPISETQAKESFEIFLENNLQDFGKYEDAIHTDFQYINHSILTPSLNIGLITPSYVVSKTLKYYNDNKDSIDFSSVEGFIRQILGWREFVRMCYNHIGVKQRTSNHFNHKNKLNANWYNGDTGLPIIDNTIVQLNNNAYTHHIIRLMVIGNIMLLCEICPKNVYEWFIEYYIDSYDWVMVPNVYGMSQFADGGLIVTKPYVASSNYISKMSNYKKGDWSDTWDSLFWTFVKKNRTLFDKNVRTKMMASHLDRFDKDKIKNMEKTASDFISRNTN